MKALYKIMIGSVLVAIVSAGVLAFWWAGQQQSMYEDSLHSGYDYDVTITTNSNLSNVTLYLPIPVRDNTSLVGQHIAENDFSNGGPAWKYVPVDTEHGLMLSMRTDRIVPKFRPLPIPIPEDSDSSPETGHVASDRYSEETPVQDYLSFAIMVPADHILDTRNPLDREPVLFPKYDMNSSQNIHNYESRIYAQYEASPDAKVEISVSMTGYNEWWVLGWQWNSYSEWMNVVLSGPQHGWVTANGTLVTGDGVYRE
jgi:hypothetical protein